jgi:hypothetical protein
MLGQGYYQTPEMWRGADRGVEVVCDLSHFKNIDFLGKSHFY